jgi:phage terminase large subunit-like protein
LKALYYSLAQLDQARQRTRLVRYKPYPKQEAFHALGATHRERLLLGANQSGKTLCETAEVTRDGVQRLLVGEPKDESQWGTGYIPYDALESFTRRQGVASALDGVMVRHESGGHSMLGFKSYDQGRAKWQGETLDIIWFDEEAPLDIYIEGLTRTNATDGMVYLTCTPIRGMSDVIYSFIQEAGMG